MVALTRKEQQRALVLGKLDRGEITAAQAAVVMELSLGYVRKLLVRYREKGPKGLAHGNRERKPAHALAPSVTAKVAELAQTKYAGLNLKLLAEKLGEEGDKNIPLVGAPHSTCPKCQRVRRNIGCRRARSAVSGRRCEDVHRGSMAPP